MGFKIDFKKGTEAVSEAFQKTSEISKKLSDTVQEKAKDLSEKNKTENYPDHILCRKIHQAYIPDTS